MRNLSKAMHMSISHKRYRINEIYTYLATLIVATLAVCFSGHTIAQNKQSDASISGHIIDAKTGEHLPYVTVMVGGTQIGIQTSSSGHYVLRNLPLGKHDIIASFVGYKDATISLDIEAGKSYEVNFSLEEESLSLDGVVVSATRNRTSRKMAPTLSMSLTAAFRHHFLSYSGGRTHVPAGSQDRERLPELRIHAGKNQRTRRTLFADSH